MDPKTLKKLRALAWKHTHRDSRGKFEDGTKTVLKWVDGSGTCLVTLDSLTSGELLAKLPATVREEFRAANAVVL